MYGLEEIKAMNAERVSEATLKVAREEVVERAKSWRTSRFDPNEEPAASAQLFRVLCRLERIEKGLGIAQ